MLSKDFIKVRNELNKIYKEKITVDEWKSSNNTIEKYIIERIVKMSSVEKARETIRDAFEKDPDFKHGYISNIAMYLYDRKIIRNYEKRNKTAEEILKLIFY